MAPDKFSRREDEVRQIDAAIRNLTERRATVNHEISEMKAAESLSKRRFNWTGKNMRQLRWWSRIRVLLEKQELEEMQTQGKGLRTRKIYEALTKWNEELKYTTFRVYLHKFSKSNWLTQDSETKKWYLTNEDLISAQGIESRIND
jgi:hypothetical protein